MLFVFYRILSKELKNGINIYGDQVVFELLIKALFLTGLIHNFIRLAY